MYPEHEKLKAVEDASRAISEFLEWLAVDGIGLARASNYGGWGISNLLPVIERPEAMLGRFFDINLKVLEAEKRVMLQAIAAEAREGE